MDRSEAVFVVILNREGLDAGGWDVAGRWRTEKKPIFNGRSCTASCQLIKHLPRDLTTERIFDSHFLIEFLRIEILPCVTSRWKMG